jgi:Holliday junction resolvase
MRRSAHTDANQAEIVRCVRKMGATVVSLAAVGQGVPDLLVGYRGVNYLFELKNPGQDKSKQRLRVCQAEWHAKWGGRVQVVTTWNEIGHAIGFFPPPGRRIEQLTLEDQAA